MASHILVSKVWVKGGGVKGGGGLMIKWCPAGSANRSSAEVNEY